MKKYIKKTNVEMQKKILVKEYHREQDADSVQKAKESFVDVTLINVEVIVIPKPLQR